jgi:hypothetical protein
MGEYFKDALKDFTFDMACGAAIRHLMELGYSEEEMLSRLDFPISAEKLHEAVIKYSKEAENGNDSSSDQYEMILEYDEYGHRSYRRVPLEK